MLITKLWCELCMNCDVHGHVLGSSCNLPVLYSYCNSFFIRDVHGEFGLLNVHLFHILSAISSKKSRAFFSTWIVVAMSVVFLCQVNMRGAVFP